MHFDIRAIAEAIGYPAAGLGILIESAGVPFPGELTLLAVAALAADGRLDIRLVILIAALGSVLGADLGYLIGHRGGRPLVERFGRIFRISPDHLTRSEMFFHRHGDKTVLIGRFVLGMRTWASVLAGMAHMPFWRFQLFSAVGGLAWAIVMGVLGFELGHNWPLLERVVKGIGYGGAVLVLVIAIALIVLRRRARRS